MALGAARPGCAPRGGRAGSPLLFSRPRAAGAPRGAAAGSGRAAGAGGRGCPAGEGAAPALGSIMPGPPRPAAPHRSGCRSSLRAAPLPPLRPRDARGLGKGGKSIRREAGAGRRAVSIPPLRPGRRCRRASSGAGAGRGRAARGARGAGGSQRLPAAPSGPDPRLGAGGARRREKPPLLLACPSLAAPALPGWASRSWRCGCWRRRGSCAVSGRRPRGQRREPRRGGRVGRGPSPRSSSARRLSGPGRRLLPFPSLAAAAGLAPVPGRTEGWPALGPAGKEHGRRTVGMEERTLSMVAVPGQRLRLFVGGVAD